MRYKVFYLLRGYVVAAMILFIFWAVLALYLHKPFLPAPQVVFVEFIRLILSGDLNTHFLLSTYRVLISLAISFLLAVPLGLYVGSTPRIDNYFAPLVYLLYPLPKIVFLPIIVLIFGLGDLPKVFLITLIVFFQILVTARDAARDIPSQWLLSMKSLNATSWQIFRHLVWPSGLPKIFTALRISLGTAIAVLFLAETFASSSGLGCFILDSMERRSFAAMYSGILAMSILGIFCYGVVDFFERRFCRWRRL